MQRACVPNTVGCGAAIAIVMNCNLCGPAAVLSACRCDLKALKPKVSCFIRPGKTLRSKHERSLYIEIYIGGPDGIKLTPFE